jgi:hypothetical protein
MYYISNPATLKIKKQIKPKLDYMKSEIKTSRVSSVDKRLIPNIFTIAKPIKKNKVNSVDTKAKPANKTTLPLKSPVKPERDILTICCKNTPEELKRIAISILDAKSVNMQIMKVIYYYFSSLNIKSILGVIL